MPGYCIYRGPSQIDGAPIIVIVTARSENRKTGSMLQTWILREDVSPITAIQNGADESICGSCPHRGAAMGDKVKGRTCYVNVTQAPLAIWRAYHRGSYPRISPARANKILPSGMVRIGSYGDPYAAPVEVWQGLTKGRESTGYTHQWKRVGAWLYRPLVMASCDTEDERMRAKRGGWRTFRVKSALQPLRAGEIVCPASEEAGKRRTCDTCGACDGSRGKGDGRADVTINAHGGLSVASAFKRRFALQMA